MTEEEPITFERAMKIVERRKANFAVSGEPPNHDTKIMLALFDEIERRTISEARDAEGDLLVNLGDMSGFTLQSLKDIMGEKVDNNHEGMVEEHIKVFNYSITQGIHPGQALFACVQAIGSLMGYAIRCGMSEQVAQAMAMLFAKTTQQAAKQVQIVTSN